jgi:ribonuclease T1
MMRRSKFAWFLMGWWFAASLFSGLALADASALSDAQAVVSLRGLPQQVAQTYALIHQGGPFVSERDGVVFGNRERRLPAKTRGYYREYTVPTPGARNRGTRRLVCGGAPRTPDVCYYTADHYESFRRVVP